MWQNIRKFLNLLAFIVLTNKTFPKLPQNCTQLSNNLLLFKWSFWHNHERIFIQFSIKKGRKKRIKSKRVWPSSGIRHPFYYIILVVTAGVSTRVSVLIVLSLDWLVDWYMIKDKLRSYVCYPKENIFTLILVTFG